jgi:signal transduction histidine kinase
VPVATGSDAGILLPGLPGWALRAERGDIFHEKEGRTRLTAWTTGLLLGLFLVGVSGLALYTRRESRDAQRKITFVTQVSHELRTPLTSIRMFADMLAEPGVTEAKRVKFAGTISAESARLGGLIERLLAFNALEKNQQKIARVELDVGAVVQETVDAMSATLQAAGMRTEWVRPATTVLVLSDHTAFKQALLNLLDNAVKYAREGPVVRIQLIEEPKHVILRVADTGPGVPKEIRGRAFEPFVQGGQTLTNKAPGVGLGLSLARGLLRQAGADLVLLDLEPGATFEIRLPKSAAV